MVRIKTVAKPFEISNQAMVMAKMIGIYGHTRLRLTRMAKRSAPWTDDRGNRRFAEFILQIEDRVVLSIDRL